MWILFTTLTESIASICDGKFVAVTSFDQRGKIWRATKDFFTARIIVGHNTSQRRFPLCHAQGADINGIFDASTQRIDVLSKGRRNIDREKFSIGARFGSNNLGSWTGWIIGIWADSGRCQLKVGEESAMKLFCFFGVGCLLTSFLVLLKLERNIKINYISLKNFERKLILRPNWG